MSMISTTSAGRNSVSESIVGRLVAACKHHWVAYVTWRLERTAMAYLRSMSDRELKDLGLSRSEIEGAVVGERATDRSFRHRD
jgi:uncharacterized protein YjiS (DUF1127 family)